jgi:DNA-binding NarL/FixJ family response regulator
MTLDGRARVLVADDHRPLRERVVTILASEFDVVAVLDNGTQVLDAAAQHRPDVLVIDLSMPGMSGLEATAALRRHGSLLPVVCLTAYDDPEMIKAALEAGALGYVTKTSLAADLVPAVHAVLQGRRFVSASFLPPTPAAR